VLKKNAHMYLMSDTETMFVLKPMGDDAGFKFWNDLPWIKLVKNGTRVAVLKGRKSTKVREPMDVRVIKQPFTGMGYHWRKATEKILFFEQGKRKLRDLGLNEVQYSSRIHKGYPSEKPVDLFQPIIFNSSIPGEVVCDPFMGSGPVGRAAVGMGRHFVGNDKSVEALMVARTRLRDDAEQCYGREVAGGMEVEDPFGDSQDSAPKAELEETDVA
jgi:site-specific DNA-methyltransferase (adenine-specific)